MKRLRGTLILALGLFLLGLASTATAGTKPVVEHFTFSDTPFFLDLSDPSGSAQCDVQAVGYDTGVVNVVTFRDSNGIVSRDILIQSLSTVFTNPENGKVLEARSAFAWKTSYTDNPDGSLTITSEFNGLNLLYRGETVTTLAGRAQATVLVTFDKRGNVASVDVVEVFTPHLGHAFPFLCEKLA
jgi:hypothetical protein